MSLLAAREVSKRYGPVVALRSATLVVEPGEIHALLGANGAGKSTLVKVLTGVIRPDAGTILLNGTETRVSSPAQAARIGLAPVFQDPALVPDLTVAQNFRLTGTPVEAVRRHLRDLDLDVDFTEQVLDVPLPMQRMLDLARALARDPQLLILDEITAALPADLAERVFTVMQAQKERGRSSLFITHRLREVIAHCDRATVLRDGGDVGTLVPSEGGEEKIVEFMLGAEVARAAGTAEATPQRERIELAADAPTALEVRSVRVGETLTDVSFALHPGEILGIAALEGQGQDELFSVLSGQQRPTDGDVLVRGNALRARHPYDAIRAGVVLVPADRLEALLPQRSVAENIAVPRFNSPHRWGPVDMRAERRRVGAAIDTLSIDTRAQRQVNRLSGGNQQKVTIARWLANGFQTLLCFDPTRGIDVGTKRQIYALLRRPCRGRRRHSPVHERAGRDPARLRPGRLPVRRTCDCRARRRRGRRGDAAEGDARARGRVSTTVATTERTRIHWGRLARRHAWTVGVYVLLFGLILYWRTIPAQWGTFDVQSLAIDALPFAFVAMAQAVVIISGGIDLSVGSMMSLINVLSAKYMFDATSGQAVSFRESILIAVLLVIGAGLGGALTGLIITVTRVADIIVTLAMLFVWGGAALAVMQIPGGGAPLEFTKLAVGYTFTPWLPTGLVLIGAVVVLAWVPIRRRKPGLSLYAIGSSRNASFLSGVSVARTRIGAYALGGALAGMGGLALTATSGIGDALSGQYYTLNSVAAVVLGGVALVGGVGGLIGPIAAAFVLTLVKSIMILKGVDQNWAQVIQGTLIVLVVMIGGLALRQRGKHP